MGSFAYPLAVLEISDPAGRAYAPLRFALVGYRKSFDRFSFPRSSVGMPTGRSSGSNDPHKIATLERLNVLPRWSVGARRARRYLSELMRQSTRVLDSTTTILGQEFF